MFHSKNKTAAEQRYVFRPKLFYNYKKLRLKNSQCTIKTQRSSKKKEGLDSFQPILKGNTYFITAIAGHFAFFFSSLAGDLFVTFDHVDIDSDGCFFIDSGKYLISVFSALCLSETFIWSKGTPCFLADFGLFEKSSFES